MLLTSGTGPSHLGATLGQLALSRRGGATLETLAAGHLLLTLSDVMQVLGADGLASMLLGLGRRSALYRLILTRDAALGVRNARDGVRVENARVRLLLGLTPTSA